MSGEKISQEELMSLFEAARWAPSSYNNQPWKFLYALRETPHWTKFFNLLIDFNKGWCDKAAVLGVVLSGKIFEKTKKPCITHALDTGSAWENLALEGTSRELVVHGMQGFDYQKAKSELKVPDEYEVLSMFAVGKRAPKETLPAELQQREVPSMRKRVSEFAFEGEFR
jgi:nitroreductase